MDIFGLPDDQVRAILHTPEGATALWHSDEMPAVIVRCPERHTLARVYTVLGTAYLVVGQTTVMQSWRTGLWGQPHGPRTWDLGRPGLNDDDWEEVRCHCRGWTIPLGYVYESWSKGEKEFILDQEDAHVPGDDFDAAISTVRSYVEWAGSAWDDHYDPDRGPDYEADSAREELSALLATLDEGVRTRGEIEAIETRARTIADTYINWDHARDMWLDR